MPGPDDAFYICNKPLYTSYYSGWCRQNNVCHVLGQVWGLRGILILYNVLSHTLSLKNFLLITILLDSTKTINFFCNARQYPLLSKRASSNQPGMVGCNTISVSEKATWILEEVECTDQDHRPEP